MTPTKLLVGQIPVVFAIVIVGVSFATEWCAAELGFLLAAEVAAVGHGFQRICLQRSFGLPGNTRLPIAATSSQTQVTLTLERIPL